MAIVKATSEDQQRLKDAAAERKRKLLALSPQFVDVIKLGQSFLRITNTGEKEYVFVWYTNENTNSFIHWEPVTGISDVNFLSDATDNEIALLQPRNIVPERTINFLHVSDIFRGCSDFVAKHAPESKPKLCLTFAVYNGTGSDLHLIAPTRTQMDIWVYGIQYVLKENGHSCFESDEQANKYENTIFEKFTARQLLSAIIKNNPDVSNLRLPATLSVMARGQSFTRFLSPTESTMIELFYVNDGKKGILYWGSRVHPEGYLPLKSVTDMWLGKHGIADSQVSGGFETSQCAVLKSRRVELSIAAEKSAIMTQWIYGINSLLSASPELLADINNSGVGNLNMPSPTVASASVASLASVASPAATSTSTSTSAVLTATTPDTIELDIHTEAQLAADKLLASVSLRDEELGRALERRIADSSQLVVDSESLKIAKIASNDQTTSSTIASSTSTSLTTETITNNNNDINTTITLNNDTTDINAKTATQLADEALSAARALREASVAILLEKQATARRAIEAATAAFQSEKETKTTIDMKRKSVFELTQAQQSGLVTMYDIPEPEYSDDSDDSDEEEDEEEERQGGSDREGGSDENGGSFEKKRGRRLSLFSQLGIHKSADIRNILDFSDLESTETEKGKEDSKYTSNGEEIEQKQANNKNKNTNTDNNDQNIETKEGTEYNDHSNNNHDNDIEEKVKPVRDEDYWNTFQYDLNFLDDNDDDKPTDSNPNPDIDIDLNILNSSYQYDLEGAKQDDYTSATTDSEYYSAGTGATTDTNIHSMHTGDNHEFQFSLGLENMPEIDNSSGTDRHAQGHDQDQEQYTQYDEQYDREQSQTTENSGQDAYFYDGSTTTSTTTATTTTTNNTATRTPSSSNNGNNIRTNPNASRMSGNNTNTTATTTAGGIRTTTRPTRPSPATTSSSMSGVPTSSRMGNVSSMGSRNPITTTNTSARSTTSASLNRNTALNTSSNLGSNTVSSVRNSARQSFPTSSANTSTSTPAGSLESARKPISRSAPSATNPSAGTTANGSTVSSRSTSQRGPMISTSSTSNTTVPISSRAPVSSRTSMTGVNNNNGVPSSSRRNSITNTTGTTSGNNTSRNVAPVSARGTISSTGIGSRMAPPVSARRSIPSSSRPTSSGTGTGANSGTSSGTNSRPISGTTPLTSSRRSMQTSSDNSNSSNSSNVNIRGATANTVSGRRGTVFGAPGTSTMNSSRSSSIRTGGSATGPGSRQ